MEQSRPDVNPASRASGTDSAASTCNEAGCTSEYCGPFLHEWTVSDEGKGSPIVDNKYFNMETGQTVALRGPRHVTFGPPSLDVYWQNRRHGSERENQFRAVVKVSALSMTEYVIGVGEFLKESKCTLQSLTATTYSVNVVVFMEILYEDLHVLLKKHGL